MIVKGRNKASFWQELANICTPRGQHRLMMASGYIFRSLALRGWDTALTSRQSQAVVSAARSEELRPSLAQLRKVPMSWMLTGVGSAVLLWEITELSRSWNHKVSDYLPLCCPCASCNVRENESTAPTTCHTMYKRKVDMRQKKAKNRRDKSVPQQKLKLSPQLFISLCSSET